MPEQIPEALPPLATDIVEVRFSGDEVDYVSINARWRAQADLAQVLAAVVDQVNAAREPVRDESARLNPDDRPLSWADLMDFKRRLARYNAAATARLQQVGQAGPQFTTSSGRHVRSLWHSDELLGFEVDPQWAEQVPVQSLSDAITDAVRDRPTPRSLSVSKEFAAARADLEQFWS